MKTMTDILLESSFFNDLPERYLDTIAGCGKNVHFDEGAYLAHEGDQANDFYLIRRGLARIEIHIPSQGAQSIQTLHPGDIAGWSWIFPPYKWQFDLKVIEPLSAVALDGQCLRNKCEVDTCLGYFLMKRFAKIMTERLKATRIQLLDVYGQKNER